MFNSSLSLLSKILDEDVSKVIDEPNIAEEVFDESLRQNELLIVYNVSYEILSKEELISRFKKWALGFGMMIRSWENAHGCIAEACQVGKSDWVELVQPENTEFEVFYKTCEALDKITSHSKKNPYV